VRETWVTPGNRPEQLLEILHDVQNDLGFDPKSCLLRLPKRLIYRALKSVASLASIMTTRASHLDGT